MVKVFTPYITVKGKRIYASQYGKQCFVFEAKKKPLAKAKG